MSGHVWHHPQLSEQLLSASPALHLQCMSLLLLPFRLVSRCGVLGSSRRGRCGGVSVAADDGDCVSEWCGELL